ncbi:MAG: hypothetical protein J5714_00935 [Alphaproteobacteria bacterium]|nr:hypothetical protein [Alphaproteobacteria bacterium]
MSLTDIWIIIGSTIGALLVGVLIALFFISRRSQRVMQSMLDIITAPDRARVVDASRVLQTIMADEMAKISACFGEIRDTLRKQIGVAEKLHNELSTRNETLVNVANDAVMRISQMTDRVDNTVTGLRAVVDSDAWHDVSNATDRFAATVAETLDKIIATTKDSGDKIALIDEKIANWTTGSGNLANELNAAIDNGTEKFQQMSEQSAGIRDEITELTKTAVEGFENVKSTASNYENVMNSNNKILNTYLTKLETFDRQSKKQLTSQMNTLTNTANIIGAQVMLTESSVEKQLRKLTEIVETVIKSATETESSVRGISSELAGLTNHFENEIKEFATDVVSELKTVSGVANTTLKDTKTAAGAFSESVKSMATGVRETLIEMNAAHTQLSGQSEGLIKMSVSTTEQLKPLSELIERYYAALPELTKISDDAGMRLAAIVTELNAKISAMNDTVARSTESVSESATKLDTLAGQSRQQMIDLMSDYAKAVDTMQTLNKQMAVARAAAPMDAIKTAPVGNPAPRASSRDFVAQSTHEFDKMYEQTVDLTRAMGTDIPDVVWKKYHDGDKTIFAKWMAKVVKAANKKQIRDLMKSDSVFRSQAAQFVRAFDRILAAAKQTDTADKLTAALIKTDLGIIYSTLSQQV